MVFLEVHPRVIEALGVKLPRGYTTQVVGVQKRVGLWLGRGNLIRLQVFESRFTEFSAVS